MCLIMIFALPSLDFKVSVFSATSKTVTLRWTRYSGATSYQITVKSQSEHVAFASFGPNTVMGSVTSLPPNVMYNFVVEAMSGSQKLSTASVESSTGETSCTSVHAHAV